MLKFTSNSISHKTCKFWLIQTCNTNSESSRYALVDLIDRMMHIVDIYVAWVENHKNKNCIFRVLRGILEGFFIKVV